MEISLYTSVYAILIAFTANIILCPIIIPMLIKLKLGQNVRHDGPQTHLKKSGTPSMGGVMILLSFLITSLFFVYNNNDGIAVILVTLGFGLVGFADDFIKVVKKRSLGLRAIEKIICQLVITGFFVAYLLLFTDNPLVVYIPFSKGSMISLGVLFIPFVFLVMLGTVNSVNLTDGLDGLASGVTVLVATFFLFASLGQGNGTLPVVGAAVGSLLGFLLFNSYPARVFMGDTGSLALGGFIASVAMILKMPLFIPIVGMIYFIEALSVMIQVGYFKLTKQRFFKMAPIHHSFELSGWSETKIVTLFYVVTAVVCLIGFLAGKFIF